MSVPTSYHAGGAAGTTLLPACPLSPAGRLGPLLPVDRRNLPRDFCFGAPPALVDRINLIIFALPGIASAREFGGLANPAREQTPTVCACQVEGADSDAFDGIGIALASRWGSGDGGDSNNGKLDISHDRSPWRAHRADRQRLSDPAIVGVAEEPTIDRCGTDLLPMKCAPRS